MTTNFHTAIAVGAAANAATFNTPLGALDEEIGNRMATAGTTTGATAQAQPFTVGITLTDTTSMTTGVIKKGADVWIHNFHHPTGNTSIPSGDNTFVGIGAGNFTMGSTATESYHGSYNTAVGVLAFASCTIGNSNSAFGFSALYGNTTGTNNAGTGYSALGANTTGSNNTAVGYFAGMHHANGTTLLATPENSIYIGYDARGKDNDDSNSIVIGFEAIGLGANTTVIGNTSTTLTALPGGALQMTEMTAPAGAANKATIYVVDNGAGKTQLMVIFGSGAAQQIAIEP